MRRIQRPVLVVLATLALAAAAPTSQAHPPGHGNRADVMFIDMMIPHHEMAIDMAEQVVERGATPAVIAMAQQIIQAQTAEIETLRDIRVELTGKATPRPMPGSMHDDMDMAELEQLSGVELDRAFLEEMIPHHADAIVMSHRALPRLRHPELRALAEQIEADQAREIGDMREMLDALSASP